ncbi:MAG: HAMP domain-containing sensor histidine kinase [Gemmatimonadetes bacterium]|nr:HAMP domain-containing sensor histidine kinase [Gemmatimonadota bacterium]
MSLRNRFTLLFVVFAVLITALGGWLAWSGAHRSLEEQMDKALLDVAGVAAHEFTEAERYLADVRPGYESLSENYREYQEILRYLKQEGHVERADIFRWSPGGPDATVLVSSESPELVQFGEEFDFVQPFIFDELPLASESEDGRAVTELFYEGGDPYKYGFARLPASPNTFLGVLIPADYLRPLNALFRRILMLSAIAAIVAGLIGWRLAGGIVARLETLSRAALRIQRGWMDRPIKLDGEDELGRLARAMERMRSGIQRRDEQLRRMLSQVAHEIRNPLGGLELFAAAAQDTDDVEERRRILGRVRKEVVGLNGIIDEFLGFARPDRSEPRLHDVRIPVEEAASLVQVEFEKSGGTLELDFPEEPIVAIADPLQVKRAVLNLIRNASQAGSRVWVEGRTVHGEVRIAVRDDGPGIAPDLRDRIFEPFVGDKEQGAGLGLAIVKQLVEGNGGRVVLADPAGDGGGGGGEGAEFHLYLNSPDSLPSGGGSESATPKDSKR